MGEGRGKGLVSGPGAWRGGVEDRGYGGKRLEGRWGWRGQYLRR